MRTPVLLFVFGTFLIFSCQKEEEGAPLAKDPELPVDSISVPIDSVELTEDTIFYPPEDLVIIDGALHFYVFGDFGRSGEHHQRDLAWMMDTVSTIIEPQFIVSTGDNFYSDGVSSVDDPLWKKSFEEIYPSTRGLGNPWYVVLGNHDYHLNPQAEIEYTSISDRWNMPDYFYFKDFEGSDFSVRMVFIDTNPFIDKYYEQGKFKNKVILQDTTTRLAWMDSLLSDDQKTWKMVVGHHPFHSGEGRGDELKSMRRHVKTHLTDHGVNVYFNGHEHVVRHYHEGGKTHYITSAAGAKTVPANDIPGTQFVSSSTAFVIVSVTSDSLYLQSISYRGKLEYATSIFNE